MKMIKRIVAVLMLCAMLLTMLVSCGNKKPGLYTWYGTRMDVDSVLEIKVDGGDGEKTYQVPFDQYRAVFVYLKGLVGTVVTDEKGNAIAIATDAEKTKALKEYTETMMMEYYTLVALGEKYGITITDADRAAYQAEYEKTIQSLMEGLEAENKKSKREAAEELYRNSLALANGMSPEYHEFMHYQNLLDERIKAQISTDMGDYLNQSYFRYKQVMIFYTKGDSEAEAKAKADIATVAAQLANGVSIDTLAAEYDNSGDNYEIYLDAYGNIVGATNESVNDITFSAIKALAYGETSAVITGDESDRAAYVAIYQRQKIEENVAYGKDTIAQVLFQLPYVGATTNTPYYNRYVLLTETYKQNMVCTPISEKLYNRIQIDTLF